MKRYRFRFELKPFVFSIIAGILFFIIFSLLLINRDYGALETKEDVVIWSAILGVGFMVVFYLVWLVVKDFKSEVKEECYQPGFDADLSRKTYLLRVRSVYAKASLTVARAFAILTMINGVVYMSGSGFYDSHRSWIIPLVITAAWLVLRRMALKAADDIQAQAQDAGRDE